jgi:hypothetical protein
MVFCYSSPRKIVYLLRMAHVTWGSLASSGTLLWFHISPQDSITTAQLALEKCVHACVLYSFGNQN